MRTIKKLLQKLARFFIKKDDFPEEEEASENVAHLSFDVAKDGNIFVYCSYGTDKDCKKLFAQMFYAVNSGQLMPDILNILYEQFLSEDRLPEYLEMIHQLSLLQSQQDQDLDIEDVNYTPGAEDTDPVVKPTKVINPNTSRNFGNS